MLQTRSTYNIPNESPKKQFTVAIMHIFWLFPGRPTPRVTWWRDHALLDDVSEDIDVATGRVTNELRLRQLRRTDLHSILTCQATNNNISVPASTSVKLDMQCKHYLFFGGSFINDVISRGRAGRIGR